MSSYKIKQYSYDQAEKLGVDIKPSSNPNKKIDVYKNNKFLYSIGDINYNDFPTYLEMKGKSEDFANNRRRLYRLRHKRDDVPNTRGWYAMRLLW